MWKNIGFFCGIVVVFCNINNEWPRGLYEYYGLLLSFRLIFTVIMQSTFLPNIKVLKKLKQFNVTQSKFDMEIKRVTKGNDKVPLIKEIQ